MSKAVEGKHVLILGAGVCGLYTALTALRSGLKVTVLEKESHVGGLAAGHQRGENYYDMGVHMLHAFDKGVFEDVSELMGDQRLEVPLDARIRWQNSTYRYPLNFKDLLKEMPFLTLIRGVSGLLCAELKRAVAPRDSVNAEEALIVFYGKPLYRFFFEGFTHKYWGIHPRELSAEFIKRKMPRLSAVDFIRKALFGFLNKEEGLTTESSLDEETLHYSQKGAYTMVNKLADEVRRLGGVIKLDANIKSIDADKSEVVYRDHQGELELQSDAILSTIPLSLLMPLCLGVPEIVLSAASNISYKPIAVYGLLINKTKAMDGLYTYFRNRVFHRVGEPKNAGMVVTPKSATVLIVETTCDVGDEKWNAQDDLKRRVIEDLESEGICNESDILEWNTFQNKHGYPVYTKGFEEHLDIVMGWINDQPSFMSTGRQGGFTYPTMHKAMRMGADAVGELMETFSNKG